MDNIISMVKSLPPVFLYIMGGSLLYIMALFVYLHFRKKRHQNFEQEHPDVSKVYIQNLSLMKIADGLQIHSVDAQKPHTFIENTKQGVYLFAGKHVIESTFTTTTTGAFKRTTTHRYGPSRNEITVEAGKNYHFYFDAETKTYTFDEQ